MGVDADALAEAIDGELRDVGTRERAEGERRYLKSELEHVGATVPQIRRIAKRAAADHPELSHDELVALVEALWSRPIHERRMVAVELLSLRADLVTPDDVDLIERLLRESRTWALVDGLAADVVGHLLAGEPALATRLEAWASDEDLWLRRAALLGWLVPLREGAPFGHFAASAEAMLAEREFFIRKAIGWVLREVGKRRPAEVYDWLAPRTDRASGVTVREAVKYLPAGRREELLAAYRGRRPAR